jgi:hypothetical protein
VIFRLWEEHEFENITLRRIFGSKREGDVGGHRRLHNEELRTLRCAPGIIKRQTKENETCGHVEMINAHRLWPEILERDHARLVVKKRGMRV